MLIFFVVVVVLTSVYLFTLLLLFLGTAFVIEWSEVTLQDGEKGTFTIQLLNVHQRS